MALNFVIYSKVAVTSCHTIAIPLTLNVISDISGYHL